MGMLDGDSIGIGAESVNLRVTLVRRAVIALDLKEEILQFPQGATVGRVGDSPKNTCDLWPMVVQ